MRFSFVTIHSHGDIIFARFEGLRLLDTYHIPDGSGRENHVSAHSYSSYSLYDTSGLEASRPRAEDEQ